MKIFNLREQISKCTNEETIALIQFIERNKGKSFSLPKHKYIKRLHIDAKRKSITSSNEIEGIRISKNRETDILINNLAPETKEEFLIYGYNKAFEMVLDNYQYQSLTESFILDLHYQLYKSIMPIFGGKYKTEQNYIREFDNKGLFIRNVFTPSKPEDVSSQMGNLLFQYQECIKDPSCNRLVLIYIFILDFLCIHPFSDGNGRISRLLSIFLLLKNGYDVDLYYPLSYLILNDLDRYYDCLEKSSYKWHENENNYMPFVHYMLEIVASGYDKLSYIIDVNSAHLKADDMVLKIINDTNKPINKEEIQEIAFSLSQTTIEKSLAVLKNQQKIQLLQKGKYAKYYHM